MSVSDNGVNDCLRNNSSDCFPYISICKQFDKVLNRHKLIDPMLKLAPVNV